MSHQAAPPLPRPGCTLVFVFGTLKQGFPNFHVNKGRRVGGTFRTLERRPLLIVGERHVPQMVDTPGFGERVSGELYEVDAAALAEMDVLERLGQPDGHQRVAIRVCAEPADGAATVLAQAYLKHSSQVDENDVRLGPLAEYTLAQATSYRRRD